MHGLCEGIPTTRGSKHANRLLACVFVQAQDHADALEMLLETLLLLCSHQLHGKEFRLVRNKDKKENKNVVCSRVAAALAPLLSSPSCHFMSWARRLQRP